MINIIAGKSHQLPLLNVEPLSAHTQTGACLRKTQVHDVSVKFDGLGWLSWVCKILDAALAEVGVPIEAMQASDCLTCHIAVLSACAAEVGLRQEAAGCEPAADCTEKMIRTNKIMHCTRGQDSFKTIKRYTAGRLRPEAPRAQARSRPQTKGVNPTRKQTKKAKRGSTRHDDPGPSPKNTSTKAPAQHEKNPPSEGKNSNRAALTVLQGTKLQWLARTPLGGRPSEENDSQETAHLVINTLPSQRRCHQDRRASFTGRPLLRLLHVQELAKMKGQEL